ncbi:MAG: hypothetical protein GY940_06195, partial [bacterium]|nr:hypothetical protein [bacterium]
MLHKTVKLKLTHRQAGQLMLYYSDVIAHLEDGEPLSVAVLQNLKTELSAIVNQTPEWKEVLELVNDSGDYVCLHLEHKDNQILNMPWSMAVDEVSGEPLGTIRQLCLTKNLPRRLKRDSGDVTKAPAPLKVLVMIASPLDRGDTLDYEMEEIAILEAFEPLMREGLVEIDFTEDGSLEALEQKL